MRQEEFRDKIHELLRSTFPLLDVMFDDVTKEQAFAFQAGVLSIIQTALEEACQLVQHDPQDEEKENN